MNLLHRNALQAAEARYKNVSAIFQNFLKTATGKCGIRGGGLLLAVSGGPDSVCLVHLAFLARQALEVDLVIGHIDHNLRAESLDDALFCEALAKNFGLPFFTKSVDVKKHMREHHASLETAARELRHRALEFFANEVGAEYIAFGHTANDQAETVLHNLSRGSGLRGAAGIPYRFKKRVRPLLDIHKPEILEFLKKNEIEFRIDASNENSGFTRNRIRREIMPFLENSLNPAIQKTLHRFAGLAREAEAMLQSQAENAFRNLVLEQSANKIVLDIERFSTYFGVLQKYIIRHSLEVLLKRQIHLNHSILSRTDALIAGGIVGKRVSLAPPCELFIDHDGVVIRRLNSRKLNLECDYDTEIALDERRSFSCLRVPAQKIDFTKNTTPFIQFVDADKIKGRMRLRYFKNGDRFFPLGADGSKSVSDFFTDSKVPQHRRKEIPILECDAGIIWITGRRIDDRFKITSQTKSFLQLEIKELHS